MGRSRASQNRAQGAPEPYGVTRRLHTRAAGALPGTGRYRAISIRAQDAASHQLLSTPMPFTGGTLAPPSSRERLAQTSELLKKTRACRTKKSPVSCFQDTGHKTGDDLLSHNLEMHYHRLCSVSLPCSGWERVGPLRGITRR
jgi:hypothetical protein